MIFGQSPAHLFMTLSHHLFLLKLCFFTWTPLPYKGDHADSWCGVPSQLLAFVTQLSSPAAPWSALHSPGFAAPCAPFHSKLHLRGSCRALQTTNQAGEATGIHFCSELKLQNSCWPYKQLEFRVRNNQGSQHFPQ